MTGDEIKERFLSFFEGRGHLRMPSASLVPSGDPTLLFTSAGMVPFKPFFLGEETPPSYRLTSSQKSFRTTDIDEVGNHKHLTFFEMLGNFSIGDYFKEQAIRWAWEFVTSQSVGLGLSAERFYVTVHHSDDEAYNLWKDVIGINQRRIYRYGDKDNWWGPAGREGPCGPCSELHYDFGGDKSCSVTLAAPWEETCGCHPNHDCERFVELWNLVFMQYYRGLQGDETDLPAPSVDTGMGLERATMVVQQTPNIYATDLLEPLVNKAASLLGVTYGIKDDTDYAIRVVAEHGRAIPFLIADGVIPSNEGRGYVLRRIIRRAIRYGRWLANNKTFLSGVVDETIHRFSALYPDLETNRDFITDTVLLEENRFGRTIEFGMPLLENGLIPLHLGIRGILKESRSKGSDVKDHIKGEIVAFADTVRPFIKPQSILEKILQEVCEDIDGSDTFPLTTEYSKMLSGKEIFVLYDTFGFPKELTEEIARENDLSVNDVEFEHELRRRKDHDRSSRVSMGGMELQVQYEHLDVRKVEFLGYEVLHIKSDVIAILVDGEMIDHVRQDQRVEIILGATPFYPEGGGQIGDVGIISGPNGMVSVEDTYSPIANLIVHRGTVIQGDISLGDDIEARVDPVSRMDTTRNHSGTHLLHATLRNILGAHVRQAGSLVSSQRLRFDYTHVNALQADDVREIQLVVNQKVREDLSVIARETTYAEAVRDGALAFFGDKYGDKVRVVTMSQLDNDDTYSFELCGGTHVNATGEIGPLFLLGDYGIGSGVRRIEAVTGRAAEELHQNNVDLLQGISRRLDTPVSDIEDRLDHFLSEMSLLKKQVSDLERRELRTEAERFLSKVQLVGGVNILAVRTSATNIEALRDMGDWLKDKLRSVVLVLALVNDGRPLLVSMISDDLIEKGLHAGDIVREVSQILGGGGGGRPETGQAGGKRLDKLPAALEKVKDIVMREIKN